MIHECFVLYDPDTGKFPTILYNFWDMEGSEPIPTLSDKIADAEFRDKIYPVSYDLQILAPNAVYVKVSIEIIPENIIAAQAIIEEEKQKQEERRKKK